MEGASTVQLVEMIDGGAFYFYHQTARKYLQPHYGNGVSGNFYLSAGQH